MERYHGLRLYKAMFRIMDKKKIIGKASKDELEAICKIVSKSIAKVDSKRTEEQVYNELTKKMKIVYTETLPSFSGVAGVSGFNSIYIDKEAIDRILVAKPEELINNSDYECVVHECIHQLQKDKTLYRGKDARGFLEGATDLAALRATMGRNRSFSWENGRVKYNFPGTAYKDAVCIMSQLEVIFGKEMVEDYGLRNNQELLDNVRDLMGKEQFNLLRKDLYSSARGKDPKLPYKYWQNELLSDFSEKELRKVNTKEDAENFLNKLKELDRVRMREKGDESLKRFYNKRLENFKERFSDFDVEKYEYKEAEFYPQIYFDEELKLMDTFVLHHTFDIPNDLDEFQKINLDDYKRYRLVKDDKIYEIVTKNGELNNFYYTNKELESKSKYIGPKYSYPDKELKESGFSAGFDENGKLLISIGPPVSEEKIENQEMEEIPLNISKEDIYKQMLEHEEDDIKFATLGEKIVRLFKRQKRLPPYSQVKEKDNIGSIKQNQEKPAWELTEEEQKNINKRTLEEVKRYPYTTNKEQQKDNNNSHDEDEFGSY